MDWTYMFDGNSLAGGLLDSLVNNPKTSTAQLLQHLIMLSDTLVGHCA